jgi:hypothetical protein
MFKLNIEEWNNLICNLSTSKNAGGSIAFANIAAALKKVVFLCKWQQTFRLETISKPHFF